MFGKMLGGFINFIRCFIAISNKNMKDIDCFKKTNCFGFTVPLIPPALTKING